MKPRITAALRSARAFDAALARVLDGPRIKQQERAYILNGPGDGGLPLICHRLSEIGSDFAQLDFVEDPTSREICRSNLQFDLANLAAFALIWATTGQRNYVRGCKAIAAERQRQRELLATGKIKEDVASPAMPAPAKFRVLFEECGEVAHAIDQVAHHGLAVGNVHTELIQVAAVCVAWLESLEGETDH